MQTVKESLSDMLKNVKDRFTNPFFFSYIISWLLINWRVSIGLLWYDLKQINALKYPTIFDFVKGEVVSNTEPIYWAIGYTILLPIFRNLNSLLHTWVNSLGNKASFKVTKESPVSVEMYMRLRENLKQKEAQVSELIQTEDKRNKLYSDGQSQIVELQSQLVESHNRNQSITNQAVDDKSTLMKQIDELKSNYELKIELSKRRSEIEKEETTGFNETLGLWKVTYRENNQGTNFKYFRSEFSQSPSGDIKMEDYIGEIIHYYQLVSSLKWKDCLIFIVTSDSNQSQKTIYRLFKSKNDLWTGFENEYHVTMESIKNTGMKVTGSINA
jgi:hypothetical protein